MSKAAIAIDTWKLSIFKKHLKKSGFAFAQGPGVTPDTLMLKVETEDTLSLQKVVTDANTECAISKALRPENIGKVIQKE